MPKAAFQAYRITRALFYLGSPALRTAPKTNPVDAYQLAGLEKTVFPILWFYPNKQGLSETMMTILTKITALTGASGFRSITPIPSQGTDIGY